MIEMQGNFLHLVADILKKRYLYPVMVCSHRKCIRVTHTRLYLPSFFCFWYDSCRLDSNSKH